jgi:predicted transposase YdaD
MFYEYLATGPEAFRVLSGGMTLKGDYIFQSPTIKGIERRIDGVYEPTQPDQPVYIIEFQAQKMAHIGYNTLSKIGLYGENHSERDVRGIIVFLSKALQPKWPILLTYPNPLLSVVYLTDSLTELLKNEPSNPFVAVFAPLAIRQKNKLSRCAHFHWQTIHTAPIDPKIRTTLEQIYEFLIFERFKDKTDEEIWTMINVLTPIEETRAYQSIFAKGMLSGKAEGKAEGKVEAKTQTLKNLLTHRFGRLPGWAIQHIDSATLNQLDKWLDDIFDMQRLEDLIEQNAANK